MPRKRLLVPLVLLVAAPFLLAACGGDDDGAGDEEDGVTEAIETVVTSDSAERCTEFQTQAFTEQTEFATGEEAITTCEGDAGDGDTAGETVEASNIEVDGDSATAEAAITGGSFDQQTLALSLVKEGDQWKLDSWDDFIDFDKTAFVEAYSATLEEDSPEVAGCVADQLTAAPDEQITSAYLSGEQDQVLAILGPCFGE